MKKKLCYFLLIINQYNSNVITKESGSPAEIVNEDPYR